MTCTVDLITRSTVLAVMIKRDLAEGVKTNVKNASTYPEIRIAQKVTTSVHTPKIKITIREPSAAEIVRKSANESDDQRFSICMICPAPFFQQVVMRAI